jgi:hypothetical protein
VIPKMNSAGLSKSISSSDGTLESWIMQLPSLSTNHIPVLNSRRLL